MMDSFDLPIMYSRLMLPTSSRELLQPRLLRNTSF
jgi:hypothetical protein